MTEVYTLGVNVRVSPPSALSMSLLIVSCSVLLPAYFQILTVIKSAIQSSER